AAGCSNGPVQVIEATSKAVLTTLPVRFGVQRLAFAPDGTLAFEQNGTVAIWGSRPIGQGLPSLTAARSDDADLDRRLERVRDKAARRALRLGAPALPSLVEECERRFGISLPAGFRRFVLEVTDGAPGPSRPVRPLAEVMEDLSRYWYRSDEWQQPFPLTEEWR